MTATVTNLPARQRPVPELERVAGGALLDLLGANPNLLHVSGLAPVDFLDPVWREAVFCMAGLAKAKKPITADTVFGVAVRLKRLSDNTETSEALKTAAGANSMTAAEFLHVARDLRRVATLRRVQASLIQAAQHLDRPDAQPDQVAQVLESIAGRLAADFEPDTDASRDVYELHEKWNEHREKGTSTRLTTGIPVLDNAIGGGFPRRGTTLLIADSGVGKTTVFASMIRAMLRATDEGLGVFGLEDGVSWLGERWSAADLGIPLSQVGWAKLSDELETRRAELVEEHALLLRRVMAYRRADIDDRQLLQKATTWMQEHGTRAFFIDVLTRLKTDFDWKRVALAMQRLSRFSFEHEVPMIAAAHIVAEDGARPNAPPAPPRMSGIAGGRMLDREASLILGLWNKGDTLRCTVLKNRSGGPKGVTIEFERLIEAGMVATGGGRVVDLAAEAAEERRARAEAKESDDEARRVRRAALAEKLKAKKAEAKAEKEAKPAQGTLLGGGA